MARYKQVNSVSIVTRVSEDDAKAIELLNTYAKLRNRPVAEVLKKLVLEILPRRIKRVLETT